MTKYGFSFCPAWEYEIVEKEGIIEESGSVIFTSKKDAETLGRRIGLINMPDEVVNLTIGGSMRELPVIEQYEYFYIMSIDIDYVNATLNKELEFIDAFKDNKIDFPPVWFTRERILPECIIHSEKILI